MNIQVETYGDNLILADMAVAILVQSGMTKKDTNELLKPHKTRIKGYGNTRFVPLEIVEEIVNPKEDELEEEEVSSETTDEEEEAFFLYEDASDEDLIKAFYESASPDDYCSPFLSGMARILQTSPKKLYRKLIKLLHPDTTKIAVEGWEIDVLKEGRDWCVDLEIFERNYGAP